MKRLVLASGVAVVGAAVWWRRHPSACPYGQRFWLTPPRPVITRAHLIDVLAPAPGERILEVGVGTGYYAFDVARAVAPGGRLDALDVQQEMVDHTVRRAGELGIDNIVPCVGDARALPYPDASFDAAYLVTVLGEIPDQQIALRELRRVLRPGGRIVVGEIVGDPHFVRFSSLRTKAGALGLRCERRAGGPLGYFADLSTSGDVRRRSSAGVADEAR